VRRVGVGLALAAALFTSACAAGQDAQTAEVRSSLDGTYATLGKIALRALAIQAPADSLYYPAGSDAPLTLVLVNTDSSTHAKPDKLVSISSPAAAGWAAYPTLAQAQAAMAASTGTPSAPAPAASATPTTPPASAGEIVPGNSAAPGASSAASQTAISIPPQRRVSWGVPEATGALLLTGLREKLYPASTIPITFTFADAGSITVAVPVQLSSSPNSSVLPGPSATGAVG
jgi:copper(I)-binding protein